jgi:hypothetical protein
MGAAQQGEGDLWDFIGVDWRRWKSEDEEKYKTGPEDDDWLDEDFALKKEVRQPHARSIARRHLASSTRLWWG